MSRCNFEFFVATDDDGWIAGAYENNEDGTTTYFMEEKSDVKTKSWTKLKSEVKDIVPGAVFNDAQFSITF